jgi:hypothetical protein
LDPHSLTLQTAQLSRPRVYNDELQHYNSSPPPNAPNWTRVECDDLYDTDIEGNSESHQDIYNSNEAESSTTGMIRDAISLEKGKAKQGTKGEC